MGETFETLIAHNKRTSVLLVVLIAGFTALLFGVLGGAMGGPQYLGTGVLAGLILSSGGAIVSYFGGAGIITMISGANEIQHSDDPELFNVVEEMAIAAGLPTPRVYLIPDESPNAFATGRNPDHALIAVTTGLRHKLSREELQGVVAHEMAHIKNYDIRLMMLVGVFAGLIVLVADFYLRNLRLTSYGGGKRDSDSEDSKNIPIGIVLMFIALILSILAPLIANLLKLAISRQREYLADATGVQFCRNPLALANALKKIALDGTPLAAANRATEHLYIMSPNEKMQLAGGDVDSMWATHPPVTKRIEKLVALAGEIGQTQG